MCKIPILLSLFIHMKEYNAFLAYNMNVNVLNAKCRKCGVWACVLSLVFILVSSISLQCVGNNPIPCFQLLLLLLLFPFTPEYQIHANHLADLASFSTLAWQPLFSNTPTTWNLFHQFIHTHIWSPFFFFSSNNLLATKHSQFRTLFERAFVCSTK